MKYIKIIPLIIIFIYFVATNLMPQFVFEIRIFIAVLIFILATINGIRMFKNGQIQKKQLYVLCFFILVTIAITMYSVSLVKI